MNLENVINYAEALAGMSIPDSVIGIMRVDRRWCFQVHGDGIAESLILRGGTIAPHGDGWDQVVLRGKNFELFTLVKNGGAA